MSKLAGKSFTDSELCYPDGHGNIISGKTLATRLNSYFVSVTSDIQPLDTAALPAFLPSPNQPPTITTPAVCHKLLGLSAYKASGPDGIPARLLKKFAPELAEPVTVIFNRSVSSGVFPERWKDSHPTPVPKVKPVTGDRDLRPIALTLVLSKVLEDFFVEWLIDDVKHHIDPQQFGSLKGTSTTYCLLDMLHSWLSSLDCPGKFLRVCFLDFSKACDHIDHTILVTKLIHLGVRGWLISWICSFLSGRRQAVKLLDLISEWMPEHAGVPQGTKLGPILFLITINDLATHSPLRSNHWKHVDDVTISEVSSLGEVSSLQNDIDCISQWALQNNMNLNPKKCKIMTICPLKIKPVSPMLSINNLPLEAVSSYKVLGLTLCDTLKWNDNTNDIVSKASKRLHILRVLKRAGVPPADLVTIYSALVRSVLEYSSVVWATCLPRLLIDQLEAIQKRALRIVYPDLHYQQALAQANITSLEDRRAHLCLKVWHNIKNNPAYQLHRLLPPVRSECHSHHIRNSSSSSRFQYRTKRFGSSFFPAMAKIN